MRKLKQRYVVFICAGQLNLWDDLLHIKCDDSTAAAKVSASFRNKIIDLAKAGLTLTEDNIMGLMLHSSLTRGSPLRQEFDCQVDQELTGRQRRVLEFLEMVDLLTGGQEKVRADNLSKARTPNPSAFAAEEQPNQTDSRASVKSHPDNIYVMAGRPGCPPSRPPATYHGCFRCGSTAHLIAQCPSSCSHTGPPHFSNGGYQHGPNPISNGNQPWFSPIIQPPGYQVHYPVLTPPFLGYSNGAPPARGLPPRQHQTGSTNPNFRPADYYCPSYGQQAQAPPARPSAQEADIMDYDIQQDTAMHYPHYLDNAFTYFYSINLAKS
ncbi:hypothetical protein PCANC_25276 [Puccinia coronata f. sp. avenae]|uniref:CCHC-type domain-containing protein n=1 Tax=Puccinia coronata f. sp. avenae TaxID=200324 RepID=A0A2N5U552_9BASI|nr:hypothetical protein PCANC_25276 [Puccinia coronata f. sp. avenae]